MQNHLSDPSEKHETSLHSNVESGGAGRFDKGDYELEKANGEVQLVADANNTAGLKLAKDGRTILIPQPSDDPRDPLNWSEAKKMTILLILAFAAFGGDFQSGSGIPLLGAQGAEWGLSPGKVNEAGNLNVVFLGIGGLIWIPPLYFWGRLPVLFWTQLLGTLFVLGSVLSQTFTQWYALRPLTSLFLTAGQTIGLTFVHDMYFYHEHARRIGLWVAIFLASPYCGPFFGGFMSDALGGWRPVMWLVFAFSCTVLLAIIFLAEETWYDRSLPQQPVRRVGLVGRICDLTGVTAYQERQYKANVFPSCMRLLEVFTKPVSIVVFVIYALSFMWAVGINITSSILFATPREAGGYGFALKTISFLYFTPLVALFIGELTGHWLNDAVAKKYTLSHHGVFRPEARLYTYFLAAPLMIAGLILAGQALQKQLNVGAVIMGWGMYVVGVMISSVSITSYILDSFPGASGEVSAMVNLSRTISGFSVGYYQMQWGGDMGFDVSFGIQAAIVGVATILCVVLTLFGERIRKVGGPLKFGNVGGH